MFTGLVIPLLAYGACISASAGIRHVQNMYIYTCSDLGFPGFIGFDINGTWQTFRQENVTVTLFIFTTSWVVAISQISSKCYSVCTTARSSFLRLHLLDFQCYSLTTSAKQGSYLQFCVSSSRYLTVHNTVI